ncbi:MAG: glycosyltransferase family 39 protein [candidate division WOR-3 bacterium]|nr:glycosyltransferase family 39 protein [candidate division WOR-3 bacterium]
MKKKTPKKPQIPGETKPILPQLSPKTIFIIALLLNLILSLLLFDPKLETGGDNALYLILGKSIISGLGLRDIHNPNQQPHTTVPPGFPLILGIGHVIFNNNFVAIKFIILLFSLGSLVITYYLLRHYLEKDYIIPLFVFATLPLYLQYSYALFSEIPFLFFTLLSFYLFEQAIKKESLLLLIFSSLAVVGSYYLRAAGLAFIVAFAIYLLWKRKIKWLIIFLLIILVLVLPWLIRNYSINKQNPYIDVLFVRNPYNLQSGKITISDFFNRIITNIKIYFFYALPQIFLPAISNSGLLTLLGIILTLIVIFGFFSKTGRIFLASIIGLIVYVGMLVVRPEVWSGDRFLLPVVPIILVYIFLGLKWLETKFKIKNFFTIAVGLLFIFINIIAILPQVKIALTNNSLYLKGDKYAGYSADWVRWFETIEWIDKNIAKDKIIMSRKPEFVYLLSGCRAIGYPFTEDQEQVKEAIAKCDYILLDNFYWTGTTRRYLLPVIQKEPDKYQVIFKSNKPEFYVLQVKK